MRWALSDPAVAIVGTIGSVGRAGHRLVDPRLRRGLLDPRADRRRRALRDAADRGLRDVRVGKLGRGGHGRRLSARHLALGDQRAPLRRAARSVPASTATTPTSAFRRASAAGRCSRPRWRWPTTATASPPLPTATTGCGPRSPSAASGRHGACSRDASLPFPPYRKTKQERELEKQAGRLSAARTQSQSPGPRSEARIGGPWPSRAGPPRRTRDSIRSGRCSSS